MLRIRPVWMYLALALALAPSVSSAVDLPGVESEDERPQVPAKLEPRPVPERTALRGPVDADRYVVGPGDVFALTIWAQATISERIPVSPEGSILLPGIANIPVAGFTLSEAKRQIRSELQSQYPQVEVEVALVVLRQIEVNVTGNVVNPGSYVGTALDPASRLIAMAGGLGENASRRNIRITRRNGDSQRVDLVRYETLGDLEANPPILDGDVIRVPFVKEEVYINGGVESPGMYEFVPGDDVGALIRIAGGLTRDARPDSLEVRRFINDLETSEATVFMDEEGLAKPLQDGDQILVRRLTEYRPIRMVVIDGEVRYPGPYGILEGEDRVLDIVEEAGGFTEDASLAQARLVRTEVAEQVDAEFERLKTIPVQDMSDSEYAYFKSRSRETKGGVVVDFERLVEGDEVQNVILRPGDLIDVPTRRETVTVSGRVTFPGMINYVPGEKPGFYIAKAGGFASNADRGDARVIKAKTGEWSTTGDAGIIVPGDEIWVPEKPDRDWWGLTKDLVTFTASVAAIYLVIDTASRN